MQVLIKLLDLGATATKAEIVDKHTDVVNMLLTISVGLFSESGDRLKVVTVDHQLSGFPIPSTEGLWRIVAPTLEAMQKANPV